ncbi:CopG family transcriptional regulator [bacterium]|nr:CopG family transcriptional regulator [bacterium]
MATTQIHLTEMESKALEEIAHQVGKTEEELLHEVVQNFISTSKQRALAERRERLRQAQGMWRGREDLPDVQELRRESDRSSLQ